MKSLVVSSVAVAIGLFAVIGMVFVFAGMAGRWDFQAPARYCASQGFPSERCDAITQAAFARASVDPDEVVTIELGAPEGRRVELGGSLVATARFTLTDGRQVDQDVWCVGVGSQYDAVCADDPEIELWAGANHDVPCAGAPPEGCATPIVLDAAAVAAARPLSQGVLDVPATPGHHEISVGSALLPGGYLSESSFTLLDRAPDGVVVPDGIRLEIRPTDPTRPPFGNVYERGIIAGVEEAQAVLVFDIESAPEDAVLRFRDIVVR